MISTKIIFLITLQKQDRYAQLKNLLENNSIWSTTQYIKTYSQHLIREILIGFHIDLAKGIKPILAIYYNFFQEKFL